MEPVYYTTSVPPEKVDDIIRKIDPERKQHTPEKTFCVCGTFHTYAPTLDSICDYKDTRGNTRILYRCYKGDRNNSLLCIKAENLDLVQEELKRFGLTYEKSNLKRPNILGWA